MKKTLGDILIEDGILTEQDLLEALKSQSKSNIPLTHILQKKGLAGEIDILKSLAKLHNLSFQEKIEVADYHDVFRLVPNKLIQKSRLVPFDLKKKTVKIALCDPSDLHPMDDIRFFLKGYKVEFVLVPEPEIMRVIHSHYDTTTSETKELMDEMDGDFGDISDLESDNLDLSNEAPIIKMVNVILSQAVSERASDIHIEPYEKTLVVRYRVDGILHKVLTPPKSFLSGISTRIKIMSI